ncbi:hypothetical protein OG943_27980 [Amycolatopsis sp. NBC_00345]|uniref:hypothetical protein n=1 Tax=Amycolatopsis sp. NBC_00345 TaxID=2975955 RepID=UPI002E270E41
MDLPTLDGAPIPGLAGFLRTAVRLHPTEGSPGVRESHVGGPLLWPAGEPWPTCPVTWPPRPGASDDQWAGGHPVDEPVPSMVGAAQFFRSDFPELPFPDGADVLQVLFCPTLHNSEHHYGPAVRLVWRTAADVTAVADPPPEPEEAEPELVLEARVLRPCRFPELPYTSDIPAERRAAMGLSDDHTAAEWPELGQFSKIGGWTSWYATDPWQLDCGVCGQRLRQALTLASQEDERPCGCDLGEGGLGEDAETGFFVGDSAALNVFLCPADVRHPFKVRIE